MNNSHRELAVDPTPLNSNVTRSELTIEPVDIGTSIEQGRSAIDVVDQLPDTLMNPTVPTFDHESHLDPLKWRRITENGVQIPGWVQYKNQVKAVTSACTFNTYVTPERAAPTLPGYSWSNLDVCGGWSRDWCLNGTKVNEDEVILRRVLAGRKVCGSLLARRDDEDPTHFSTLDLDIVRDSVAERPQFELAETPFLDRDGQVRRLWDGRPVRDVVRCWVAPRKTLGEVIPIVDVANWYDRIDNPMAAESVRAARDLYLPDLADRYDVDDEDGTRSFAVTGLILGYPPASNAGFRGMRFT
jgi:hypothetical protein